jgi:hypothetical protein
MESTLEKSWKEELKNHTVFRRQQKTKSAVSPS